MPRLAGGIVVALACARVAPAQRAVAVDVSLLNQFQPSSPWQPSTLFGLAGQLESRWSRLSAVQAIEASTSAVGFGDGQLSGSAWSAPLGPFRLSSQATLERFRPASDSAKSASAVMLESALSFVAANRGIWAGGAMERSIGGDSSIAIPRLRMGIWQRIASAMFSVTGSSHVARSAQILATTREVSVRDSFYTDTSGWSYYNHPGTVVDSTRFSRAHSWSEIEGRASWTLGRVTFDATVGARDGTSLLPRTFWGNAMAAWQLTSRVSLVAGGGTDQGRLSLGVPSSRYGTLALRWAPMSMLRRPAPLAVSSSTAAFALRSAGGANYDVVMRVPHARRVEISGDFNAWKAVELHETHPDTWEATLTLTPGTYHLSVRIDGARWSAPPGVPTLEDEFNGTVGIVVVR